MPALLAAETVAGLDHVLIDILVADLGLVIFDADLVERFIKAEVGHDRRNDLVVDQLAALFHIQTVYVQHMVARDDVALFIHAQAAVRVTVKGKANIEAVVNNILLQMLDMGTAAVRVDVIAVRLGVDDIGLGAERVEHGLCDLPGGAVGTVETDLDVLEAVFRHRDQMTDIAVASGDIVDRTADSFALGNRDLQLAVDIVLDLEDGLLVHLFPVAVEQLDTVVIVRIVGCGDHDAAVEIVHTRDIRDRGRGRYMHDIGVGARGHQTRAERVFKHIGRAAGILADDDLCLFVQPGAIVPSEETADLDGMVKGQVFIGFTAKAVRSEILAHLTASLFSRCRGNTYTCRRSARRRPLHRRR